MSACAAETDADAAGMEVEFASAVEDWPERRPLPDALPAVSPMPTELLPDALRGWVDDAADRMQVAPEMIAAPAIVSLGALIGRSVAILPQRWDDWYELANLWGAVVAAPAQMKTAALSEGMRHLRRCAELARESYADVMKATAAEREAIALRIDGVTRAAKGAKGDPEHAGRELAALRRRLDDIIPIERRYITQDTTVEALGMRLAVNPRGLLIERDELCGWLAACSKPGREGDRELYLEAWSARGSYTVDRVGRGTVHIPAVCVSIIGGMQPGKLAPIVAGAIGHGVGADGLLQRLQVLVWPDTSPTYRPVDRWPDSAARQRAWHIFERLNTATPDMLGASTEHCAVPALRYTPDAQELFNVWRVELEQRLRSPALAATPAYAAHLGKYRGLMPRLALLSHLSDVADEQIAPGPVSLAAAQRAAAWIDYLDMHARRVYAIEIDSGRSAARAIAAKIDSGDVTDRMPVRDVRRAQWSGLRMQDAIDAGLAELVSLGWVRLEYLPTDGRHERVIRLHPELRRYTR